MKQFNEKLKKVIRLHIEEKRIIRNLTEEYSTSKASISNWVKQYLDECQINLQSQKELKSNAHYNLKNILIITKFIFVIIRYNILYLMQK